MIPNIGEQYKRIYEDQINKEIAKWKAEGRISTKNISDGYHTIGDLYEHRAILTASLFNLIQRAELYPVYKSWQHHDGTMFDGMFIVYTLLPNGMVSYHYNPEWWNHFDIPEVEKAHEWDGHNAHDTIERLEEVFCNG